MSKITKAEGIRRARLGDLRRLFRARWGPVLPDDAAGIGDLEEMLAPISLGREAIPRMKAACEVWAPWLPDSEAWDLIYMTADRPRRDRKVNARTLGQRLRLTNDERERYKLWTIKPVDMTDEQLAKQRRDKDRDRKRKGRKPRPQYLNEVTKPKPWVALGISRRTYYYRKSRNGTGSARRANGSIAPGASGEPGCIALGASEAKSLVAMDGPSATARHERRRGLGIETRDAEPQTYPVSVWGDCGDTS